MPRPSHYSWFDQPNIWWAQIKKLLLHGVLHSPVTSTLFGPMPVQGNGQDVAFFLYTQYVLMCGAFPYVMYTSQPVNAGLGAPHNH
jgi:hypothetical protein